MQSVGMRGKREVKNKREKREGWEEGVKEATSTVQDGERPWVTD